MSYLRQHRNAWQSIIRIKGHPNLAKSFKSKTDAKRWSIETELKIRCEGAGIVKINYPTFNEIGLRYIADASITKKGFINERNIIKSFMTESWSEFPLNKITPDIIRNYCRSS